MKSPDSSPRLIQAFMRKLSQLVVRPQLQLSGLLENLQHIEKDSLLSAKILPLRVFSLMFSNGTQLIGLRLTDCR